MTEEEKEEYGIYPGMPKQEEMRLRLKCIQERELKKQQKQKGEKDAADKD